MPSSHIPLFSSLCCPINNILKYYKSQLDVVCIQDNTTGDHK